MEPVFRTVADPWHESASCTPHVQTSIMKMINLLLVLHCVHMLTIAEFSQSFMLSHKILFGRIFYSKKML